MAPRKGSKPWNAGKGKGHVNQRGYRVLKVNGREVKEHRYVLEQHLGRSLLRTEDVHHINGDKTDNRIENLQLVRHGDHTKITNAGREYRRGYKCNLRPEERARRVAHARAMHAVGKMMAPQQRAALSKARGDTPT